MKPERRRFPNTIRRGKAVSTILAVMEKTMRSEYDFTEAVKNPHQMGEQQMDCAANKRQLVSSWKCHPERSEASPNECRRAPREILRPAASE